jgi:hypothetical protein
MFCPFLTRILGVPPNVILKKFIDGSLVSLKDGGGGLITSGCELQLLCMKSVFADTYILISTW